MTELAVQRANMVESQVRPSDVTDRRIVRAMGALPRERFVADEARAVAYMDQDVPAKGGAARGRAARMMLAPRALAKLVQLADLDAGERVLDVGCASGYSTALLAQLAGKVIGLEADAGMADAARSLIAELKLTNAQIETGALSEGARRHAPFDAILLQGCIPEAPGGLLGQLKPGGRLVAILADGTFGKATIWRRSGESADMRPMFDAGGPALPGFERKTAFVF